MERDILLLRAFHVHSVHRVVVILKGDCTVCRFCWRFVPSVDELGVNCLSTCFEFLGR